MIFLLMDRSVDVTYSRGIAVVSSLFQPSGSLFISVGSVLIKDKTLISVVR